jgi:hypothetical protein
VSTPLQGSDRVRKIQRSALTMLLISNAINYIDRSTLAVATPLISHDLGLSIADMGYLLSAFLWAYAFAPSPVIFREWEKLFQFRTTWGIMTGFFGLASRVKHCVGST